MPKLRGHWQHRQEEVSELCRHGFILAALAPSSSLGRCQQGGSVRYKLTAFYQCLIDCSTTGSRWSCSGGFYGFSSFVVGTTRVSFTAAEGDLESTSELTSQCGSKSRCQITTSVTIFAEFMLKSFFFYSYWRNPSRCSDAPVIDWLLKTKSQSHLEVNVFFRIFWLLRLFGRTECKFLEHPFQYSFKRVGFLLKNVRNFYGL